MSCPYIFDLSTGVWVEVGQPSSLPVATISGRFVSIYYLGKLNNLIGTCYSGASGCIIPAMEGEEMGIYSEMFKSDFYATKINENLGAAGIGWTEISEGDESIKRASPTNIAQVYKDLKKQTDDALGKMVNSYISNQSSPKSIDFYSTNN